MFIRSLLLIPWLFQAATLSAEETEKLTLPSIPRSAAILQECNVSPFSLPGELKALRPTLDGEFILASAENRDGVLQFNRSGVLLRKLAIVREAERWAAGRNCVAGEFFARNAQGKEERAFRCVQLEPFKELWSLSPLGQVLGARFTPDGTALVVVSMETKKTRIALIDAISGQLIWAMGINSTKVEGIEFPTPELVAIRSTQLALLDLKTGQLNQDLLRIFSNLPKGIRLVGANQAQRRMLFFGGGRCEAWSIESPVSARQILNLAESDDFVPMSACMTADGNQVLVEGWRKPRLYDLEKGGFKELDLDYSTAAIIPNQPLMALGCCAKISLVSTVDWKLISPQSDPAHSLNDLVFSPDNQFVLSPSKYSLYGWDVATGKPTHTLASPGKFIVRRLAFHPDGTLLFHDGTNVWTRPWPSETHDSSPCRSIMEWPPDRRNDLGLTVSRDGARVAAALESWCYQTKWGDTFPEKSAAAFRVRLKQASSGRILETAYCGGSEWLCVLRSDSLDIYDAATQGLLMREFAGGTTSICSGAPLFAYAASVGDSSIVIRSAPHGELQQTIPVVAPEGAGRRMVNKIAFSQDGRWLAAAVSSWREWEGIYLWELESGELRGVVQTGEHGGVAKLVFDHAGDRLATLNADQSVTIFALDRLR